MTGKKAATHSSSVTNSAASGAATRSSSVTKSRACDPAKSKCHAHLKRCSCVESHLEEILGK